MKKNQLILLLSIFVPFYGMANSTLEMIEKLDQQKLANQQQSVEVKKEEVPTKKAVSYTHLTLPTICSV